MRASLSLIAGSSSSMRLPRSISIAGRRPQTLHEQPGDGEGQTSVATSVPNSLVRWRCVALRSIWARAAPIVIDIQIHEKSAGGIVHLRRPEGGLRRARYRPISGAPSVVLRQSRHGRTRR